MPAKNPLLECPGCRDALCRAQLSVDQQCSGCRKKERNRLWRLANPDAMAANAKRWRDAGNKSSRPDDYAEWHRQTERERYRSDPDTKIAAKARAAAQREQLGRDRLNEIAREWRKKNPEKSRVYYLQHIAKLAPEERKAKGQRHRERYRVQRQAGQAAYYARRYGGTGVITNEHLVHLHKWQDHCCFYCRQPLGGAETIEHVVPLSRQGTNNPWNVVLVCGTCNYTKGSRIFETEWRPECQEAAPRWHSLEGMRQLKKALLDENISFRDEGDHLMIGERPVYILSSFWLGWQGDGPIKAMKARHPAAIIFFDKEYVRRPEAVVNVLKAKAGIALRTGARKLRMETPTPQEAKAFISRWHAMGGTGGTHYLGLRDDTMWWAIAAFRQEEDRYEVIRMAIRNTVAGGVSRIIEHFRRTMPERLPIVAFTDQRMGDGKSHFFAGFDADGTTERSFFYATPEVSGFYPRRDFQKQVLEARAEYFDPDKTQVVNAKANGLMRVEGLPRLRYTLPP